MTTSPTERAATWQGSDLDLSARLDALISEVVWDDRWGRVEEGSTRMIQGNESWTPQLSSATRANAP